MGGAFEEAVRSASGTVTGVLDQGRQVVESAGEAVGSAVAEVGERVESGARTVTDSISRTTGRIGEAITQTVVDTASDIAQGGDGAVPEILGQGEEETSSDRPTDDRGEPHPDRNELRQQWRQAGEQRIQAFTSLFGQDALVLGHLLFRVPPLAIRVNKGNMTYRWKPLRTKESVAVKSGNGECYIEIDLAFNGITQINESLAHLITLWKKFPFCFVENAFIRSQMIPGRPEDSMMLCLESLVLDAQAGTPNTVWATLVTSWFNYKTFSQNAWYRRHWQGINDPDEDTSDGRTATDIVQEAEDQRVVDQLPRSDADTTLIDLSALQSPEDMAIAMPPEARLEIADRDADPSDPFVKPTYPVVYPWNSVPFMERVLRAPENPKFIERWTDGLTMRWNSFTRVPMPKSLAYEHQNRSIEITRPGRPRTVESDIATPVSGDRNIILFIGDSITVGFLHLSGQYSDTGVGQARNDAGQFIPVPLHSFRPPHELATNGNGFEFYSIARVGAWATGGGGLAGRFETLFSSNEFKTPGGADGSRLAAVIFMAGINDRPGTTDGVTSDTIISAYDRVKSKTLLAEAMFIPMTPFPLGGIRDNYVNSTNEGHLVSVCEEVMRRWGNETSRWKAINLHEGLSQTPTEFTGLPLEGMGHVPAGGGLDPHPPGRGNSMTADWIDSKIPWNTLRANAGAAETWTVCHVEDGDTIWVFKDGEIRVVRFLYMNTLETYTNYNNPADTELYGNTSDPSFGTGQDAGRPADQQFGHLAKLFSIQVLGAAEDGSGNGATCEIEFAEERDAYNRYLGVISKGPVNLNLRLVQEGLATVPVRYRDADEGAPYVRAYEEAQTARRGIHGWRDSSSLAGTRVLLEPSDWLAQHPPHPDGEFGFSPDNPPPGCQGVAS